MITSKSFRYTLINTVHHGLQHIFQLHIVAIVHKTMFLFLQVYTLSINHQVFGLMMIN